MIVVFSDLDGTLLDHSTYSYEESMPGVNMLKEKSIPLVLVSSKTYDEMVILHKELKLEASFIFENGAGIANYNSGNYTISLNGKSSEELINFKSVIEQMLGVVITPLCHMSTDDIVQYTGLKKEIAEKAAMRKGSMPFIIKDSSFVMSLNDLNSYNNSLKEYELMMTRGGRFYHFSSINANKGFALSKVIDEIKSTFGESEITSYAIGDSENDIPMLKVVDNPFLVRKYNNTYIETGVTVTVTNEIGPKGFTEMVYFIMNEHK